MKKLIAMVAIILTLTALFGTVASAEKKTSKNTKTTKIESLSEIEEASFNGTVKIKMVTKKSAVRYGKEVTLKAVVKGAKKGTYTLQWEVREAGAEEFTAIENENSKTLTFTLTEENAMNEYRVAVVAK